MNHYDDIFEFNCLNAISYSMALPNLGLPIGLFLLLGLLLSLGRRLEPALKLERLGLPIALLVGLIAISIGPYGKWHLLPSNVTDLWGQFPTPLLTLVFATLMLGRPIPAIKDVIKPVATQASLGLLLGFGQYLVGGVVVLFVLIPFFGVDPLMGCLIEVGFEGGHGAAAIMGKSFEKLGFSEGLDLGLAMATLGLLSSTVFGSVLIVIGKYKGWVVPNTPGDIGRTGALETNLNLFDQVKQLFVNLGFSGAAVLLGVLMLNILRYLSQYFGYFFQDLLSVFPVFPFALLSSLIIRYFLDLLGKGSTVSQILQREIGTLATDLLIITAMASLNLDLLKAAWVPLAILSTTGLIWNLIGMLFFGRIIFNDEWFERSITEFGNASGVAASGLLLLRLADPRNITNTLPIFSIKQLLLQPLLSGGVITVLAPIAVRNFGLAGWTEVCGFFTVLFITLGLIVEKNIALKV